MRRDAAGREGQRATAGLGRVGRFVGALTPDLLAPPAFRAETLLEQIRWFVARDLEAARADVAALRVRYPDDTVRAALERLFRPYLARALRVQVGELALEVVPLAVLFEDAARHDGARSLLGRQIQLLVRGGLLLEPGADAARLGELALEILDEVHSLAALQADLRRRAAAGEVGRGATGAARLAWRAVNGWTRAGSAVVEAYTRYSRFGALRAALLARSGGVGDEQTDELGRAVDDRELDDG